jgi:hypothetical protein
MGTTPQGRKRLLSRQPIPAYAQDRNNSGSLQMANREQRSSREKKKPKAEKSKANPATTSTSPFEQQAQKKASPGKK